MTSQADMAAELSQLRRQLAKRDEQPAPLPEPAIPDPPDWDIDPDSLIRFLQDLPQKNPMMLALGFVLGRAGSDRRS